MPICFGFGLFFRKFWTNSKQTLASSGSLFVVSQRVGATVDIDVAVYACVRTFRGLQFRLRGEPCTAVLLLSATDWGPPYCYNFEDIVMGVGS